ncbi:carboxymuconolactone decarboxylase family protein [Streptomyces turgidiscabies]|uniref:Alkylhydroperoxidase AhpD family core domain protein n=1 Tax=Streptomyces turgidiscabies (strain Car8) TaxID=698760 RepID=L7ET85_STRT8|nr:MULTISPECIES: carboxymuconolactone decarboxylase family protein [Streptomyces]ELP61595.1 alkylhydroperoxidase AhpD family core domain protein [Streptomyces turgidiscabies Car8]MDX3499036.1 carboxymuconolactone decarboxylase family protein [Streptomyces turgidiscabies]GAQ73485.1 carboxymuconolactone decarboxylase family [Streptomyces turgidiscabies]
MNRTRRITPLPHTEYLKALGTSAPDARKPPSNALGLLARHPDLAKAFLEFNKYLLVESTLPKRTRELVILRVAWRRRCRYEWAQHVLIARRAGLTDDEIGLVRTGAPTPLNRAVDELETDSRLSDATYQALATDLDDRQLMDLVFTVGTYGVLATALNTFEVELDPGIPDENFNSQA